VDATEEELKSKGVIPGFIGPFDQEVRIVIDAELKGESNMICGANKVDYHTTGVSIDFADEVYDDITAVAEGDTCVTCGGTLHHTKGIEVGHIFQLGTRYSKPLGATFLNEQGKSEPMVMGTYGIGVSRLIAAIIEQHHDDSGCIWTKESAPYLVDIVTANGKDEEQMALSQTIYDRLNGAGIATLWDDRKERIGFKMKDYELIGLPFAIIVGKRANEGIVEFVERTTLEKVEMSVEAAIQKVLEA